MLGNNSIVHDVYRSLGFEIVKKVEESFGLHVRASKPSETRVMSRSSCIVYVGKAWSKKEVFTIRKDLDHILDSPKK